MDRRALPPFCDLSAPLLIASLLAAIAGYLDAHLFLHVDEVFVANQSGNVILFGMGLGQGAGQGLWRLDRVLPPAVALATFAAGMAVATAIHDRRLRLDKRYRPDLVLGAEALLVLALGLLLWRAGRYEGKALGDLSYLAIAAGSLAMGLQTALIKRVGDVAVATTYESGAIAQLGEQAAHAALHEDPVDRLHRRVVIRVLGTIVGAYAAGAAVSAAIGDRPWELLVPVIALAAIGAHVAYQLRTGAEG